MAQAHRLLGSRVSVLEAASALAKDDPELAALLLERLRADGIVVEEGARIRRVEREGQGVAVVLEDGAGSGGSPARICWWRRGGAPISPASTSTRPASPPMRGAR